MSTHSHTFPAEYPFDCLMSLAGIIRRGELAEKKYEAIQHCCWFIGCAAEKLKAKTPDLFAAVLEPNDCASLEELADELTANTVFASSEKEPAEIDPTIIIAIIGIVINILINLRKQREDQ